MSNKPFIQCKLAILGEQACGKSSIAVRYVRDTFNENCDSTIGAAFLTRTVETPLAQVKLQIWDTAGQERYRSLTPMYYRNASAAIVVFDITSRTSFDRAQEWIKELREDPTPKVICLAANKNDLRDRSVVSEKDAQALAQQHGVKLFFTSAKTGESIGEMFGHIVSELPKLEQQGQDKEVVNVGSKTAGGAGSSESGGGCSC